MPTLIERTRKDSVSKANADGPVKEAWGDDDVEYAATVDTDQQCKEIQNILKRIQFIMTLFGIFIPGQCKQRRSDEKKPIFHSKLAIYNILVLTILWFLVFNRVAFFLNRIKAINSTTIFYVITLIWHFNVAINATFMLKASHPRFGHGAAACSIWNEKVLPLFHELKLNIGVAAIKRHVLVVSIVGYTCIILSCVLIGVLLFYPDTLFYAIMPDILIAPLPVHTATKIIFMVILIYMSIAWIMPSIYCITLCVILRSSFKTCAKAVEIVNEGKKCKNIFPECLYRQRVMHLHICKVVEVFDKDVKYFFVNLSVTNLSLTCILVYQMLKTELDTLTIIAYLFWLIYAVVSFWANCSYAAKMNKAAHSPLDYLYETGMKGVTMDQLGQINLFIAKLTAVPIGFSVLDFIVITKELILTVAGLIVTYSFVLLQF